MRILIAQPWIRAGGAELLSVELSEALEAGGDEVPIAALFVDRRGLPPTADRRTYVLPPRILSRAFERSHAFTLLFGPFVLLWLMLWAGRRADVLNPHNLPAPIAAAIAGPLLGRPVVWTCNEVPARLPADEEPRVGPLDALIWRVGGWLGRPAARAARRILVLSDKAARDVRRTYGREATVIRAGVDQRSFTAVHTGTRSPLALLFVAKLHPQKDPLLAVRTLAAVRDRGVEASLTIVGDGPERAAVEELVAASGLTGQVTIERGLSLPELIERYRRSDVLLVTAGGHQSWGLTPFEALLAGTPSVISPEAGAVESLAPADAALVVPRTQEAFAAAAIRLRDEPGLAAGLVGRGQALCAELTWTRYAEATRAEFVRAQAARRERSPSDRLALAVGSVAVAALIAQLLFFFGRFPLPWPDETLFAEPAIGLLRDGRLASPLFTGPSIGTDQHLYWMPPGYFLLVSGAFAIAGPGLDAMRAISVAGGLATIVLAGAVARRVGGPLAGALAMAFLAFDPVFVRASLVGRMDVVAVTLTLGSIMLALDGRRLRSELAAGALASGAALVHPLGLVALGLVAARPLLGLPSRMRYAAAGAALPLLGYAFFALQAPAAFVQQLSLQLDRKETRGTWDLAGALRVVVDQYGGSPVALAPVLAWIAGLIGLGVAARRSPPARLLFLALLVELAAISLSAEMWYPLYVLPFAHAGVAVVLATPARHPAGRGRRLARAAAIAAVTTTCIGLVAVDGPQLAYRWRATGAVERSAYSHWSADVARAIPSGARVLVGGAPDPAWDLVLGRRDIHASAILDTPRVYRYYAEHLGDFDYAVVTGVIPTAWIALFASNAIAVTEVTGTSGLIDADCADGWTPCRTLDARIYRLTPAR